MVFTIRLGIVLQYLFSSQCILISEAFARQHVRPMDVQEYVDEARFRCSEVIGCPMLEMTWGQVIAHDPVTNATATFRDVMAGPGWVKEWNWGHHEPRTTHATGPAVDEIREMRQEMQVRDASDTSLAQFYMSLGVQGILSDSPMADAEVRKRWGIDPVVEKSEPLVGNYASDVHTAFLQRQLMVASFNEAVKNGRRAAILLHSTC
eukprot:TRINITY_DN108507_c0_g1_i1.p1 TRINITY_DN108507_c0_g1~~TRINITY_DN108507_c0_g1_i1.p1  ORF type:complete len:206 (+),score=28.43 TRINITY_DN108507_c0_g1_i1:53-670(+)